ncbi:DUF3847 domain-containing protein [Ruthenibacterium lactatiformans]|uniref:DUF3847 domain-containing protein n=1 Tax=Ruthenibacterium lactatiformans TaxID=1550024 RepID=UPI001967AE17|nr:DUF3847 domain-containing protein [Ruthenibacterium lactatiformans]MBN3031221.1 DUF3847 domain-containing protein [Ruthenibacterium lactatiformans]
MLDRRLAIEKRKERNHRLCSRGGFIESIVPELITMTDEDAQTFFRLALTSEPAREFLRKRAEETTTLTSGTRHFQFWNDGCLFHFKEAAIAFI